MSRPRPTGPELRRKATRDAAIILAAALFMAMSGAFIGGQTHFISRFGYWVAVMLLGTLWGELAGRLIGRLVDLDDRPWLGGAVMTLAIALPMSVTVWAVTGPAFGYAPFPLRALPDFFAPVLTVTAIMTALAIALGRRPVQTHAAAASEARPVAFLERLPPKLKGAALIAVEAEDHYLRLHTDRGSDLILMRLSDALKALEGLEGAQTHRSWWVAKSAVVSVSRGDGRAELTLDGGLTVPVSRRHARALRAAGWW